MSIRDAILAYLRSHPGYVALDVIHNAVARYERFNILKFVLAEMEDDGLVDMHPDASKHLYVISEKASTELATYSSSDWTGLPSHFVLTEKRRESLVVLLMEAELTLDSIGAGNVEKRMAAAYIVAARTLAEAPDPPVDLIWEIIGKANNLAGIASLFVAIIALFTAVTH